jgi:hypothetical protein
MQTVRIILAVDCPDESTANAAWLKTENRPIYSQEHLLKMSVFTRVLHVTYRAL